jgi:hypothetical protein
MALSCANTPIEEKNIKTNMIFFIIVNTPLVIIAALQYFVNKKLQKSPRSYRAQLEAFSLQRGRDIPQ